MVMNVNGRVAQRITRLPTEQKIAGSNPAAVKYFFNFCKRRTQKVVMNFSFSRWGAMSIAILGLGFLITKDL